MWLSSWSVLTVHSVAFIIQSAAFSAEHLEGRVDAFIEACTDLLESMPEEEFTSQVRAREVCPLGAAYADAFAQHKLLQAQMVPQSLHVQSYSRVFTGMLAACKPGPSGHHAHCAVQQSCRGCYVYMHNLLCAAG